MKKEIIFYPAYDKRNSDPSKNYGIHGVTLGFYLTGDKGTVQFTVFTGWHLPHVQDEIDSKPISKDFPFLSHKPMPADLGYHAKEPQYEGQSLMQDDCKWACGKCYYDGSSLNAEPVFKTLTEEGSDGVWRSLEEFYDNIFETSIQNEEESK